MRFDITSATVAALGFVNVAQAHTVLTNFYVGNKHQGWGTCIRQDLEGRGSSSPIDGIESPDMACGRDGEVGRERVCPVPAGSTMTFEFHTSPNDPKSKSLDPGHHGPCAVYLKKVESAMADDNAAGDGWFKIWEDFDVDRSVGERGEWCTNRMINNGGMMAVDMPADIETGYYLVRTELLALHAAYSNKDPQFYVHCVQVYVEGTDSGQAAETVDIPGNYVDMSLPEMTYNIYENEPEDFVPYGPPAYGDESATDDAYVQGEGGSDDEDDDGQCEADDLEGDGQPYSPPASPADGDIEGQWPENCIARNVNWCGVEVSDYTERQACWDSAEECWDQGRVCWDTAGAPGGAGCELWSKKCEAIANTCRDEVFPGPPNKGEQVTPAPDDLGSSKVRRALELVERRESHHLRHARRGRHH